MKDRLERLLKRRMVRGRLHDVSHVIPPFAHHLELRQRIHGVICSARQNGEKMVRACVEEDPIVTHAGVVQCINQFGPDLRVTSFVFLAHAGVEHHPESDCFHCGLSPVVSGRFPREA